MIDTAEWFGMKLKLCLEWSFSVTEWQRKVQQDDNYQSLGNMTWNEALCAGEHIEGDSHHYGAYITK